MSKNASALAYANDYSLYEAESILPSQFFDTSNCILQEGERKLMAAVLSDGVEAYINYKLSEITAVQQIRARSVSRKRTFQGRFLSSDIQHWVESKDSSYVFSFDLVCEALGINPDYLRFGLNRYLDSIIKKQKSDWKKLRRPRT